MSEPQLKLLDISGLVERLNSALAESEPRISRREFELKEPRKNPFLYRARDRELESRGKYQLGILKPELGVNLGYVFVETGFTNVSDDCGGGYETLRFRTYVPIELRNGNIIPECSVKLLIETEEIGPLHKERKDHTRKAGLIWVRSDLSSVLPTEWFLGRSVNEYELRTTNTLR